MSSNIMAVMLLKRWTRRDKRRARWIRPPRTRAFALLLALGLSSCSYADGILGGAGTTATFSGAICGQAVDARLVDRKDRSEATFTVNCGNGASVTFSSMDSSTSAVINAVAQLAQQVGALAAQVATSATGAAYQPPAAEARSIATLHARLPMLKPHLIEAKEDQL